MIASVVSFLTSLSRAEVISLLPSIMMSATLIVLICQIRLLIRSARTAQYQTALHMMFEWRSDIINHPTLAERYKSSTYFKEVFGEQGIESYFHTLKLFHTLEVFYLLQDYKIINAKMWSSWKQQADIVMTPDKNRKLWRRLKAVSVYNAKFVKEIDAVVDDIEKNLAHKVV